jgi:hypothetical protein
VLACRTPLPPRRHGLTALLAGPQFPRRTEGRAWYVVEYISGETAGRFDTLWEARAIADAIEIHKGRTTRVVPVYRGPSLTAAEIEAIDWAANELRWWRGATVLANLARRARM